MKDYVGLTHQCMENGIDIRGYFFWSTFDNFEWNLGPPSSLAYTKPILKPKSAESAQVQMFIITLPIQSNWMCNEKL